MFDAQARLAAWTVLAGLVLVLATVEVIRDRRRHRAAPPGDARWLHRARLIFAVLMLMVWAAVVIQGLLGFRPELSAWRSWTMLALVLLLAAAHGYYLWSWGRIAGLGTSRREPPPEGGSHGH